jgi:hypothetical protein
MPTDSTVKFLKSTEMKISLDKILTDIPFLQKMQLKLNAMWLHGMHICTYGTPQSNWLINSDMKMPLYKTLTNAQWKM